MARISIPFSASQVETLWMHLYNVVSCGGMWLDRGGKAQWEGLERAFDPIHGLALDDGSFVPGTAEFEVTDLDCLVVELERVTLDPDCYVGMDTPMDVLGARRSLESILYHIAQVLEGKEIGLFIDPALARKLPS